MMRFNPKHQALFLITLTVLFLGCNNLVKNEGIASKYTGKSNAQPLKMLTAETASFVQQDFVKNHSLSMPVDSLMIFPHFNFNENLGRNYHQEVTDMVRAFYHANNNESKWLGSAAPYPIYFDLISLNNELWKDGLDQNDYLINYFQGDILGAYNKKDGDKLKKLDYHLTYAFFLISHHLAYGKIDPEMANGYWHMSKNQEESFTAYQLSNIHSNKDLFNFIKQVRPQHSQYERLRNKLIKLTINMNEGLVDNEVLSPIETPVMPGDTSEFIPALRVRMASVNPEVTKTDNPNVYDSTLTAVVRAYQSKNGLVADGEVGNVTIDRLNQTVAHQLEKIKVNMERLRWLPGDYGDNHIVVNIPNYTLELIQNGQKSYEMRVVVGANKTRTPVFADTLQYLVFSPTWTVPRSIKVNEILYKLRKNKNYYSGRDYKFYVSGTRNEINPSSIDWNSVNASNFNYDVVQQPGSGNSLGKVKFIMPNSMNIYLHDTPSVKLFARNKRNFSHGCVRVAEPEKLAELLLNDHEQFDNGNLGQYMSLAQPKHVNLKKNYHVQIEYRTAWVDDQGELQLRDDVYGYDKLQVSQLKQHALAFVN